MQKLRTIGLKVAAGWVFAAMVASPLAGAQAHAPCDRSQAVQSANCPACTSCAVVSEIDDPSTGQHWLLMRDPARPGGPGALVAEGSIPGNAWLKGAVAQSHPVIRAGDRLMVEESSAVFDLRLEGIALSPAALGAPLRVRLVVSGKVVRAVALGPGHATKVPDQEFWP